jgi:hypothetical protein
VGTPREPPLRRPPIISFVTPIQKPTQLDRKPVGENLNPCCQKVKEIFWHSLGDFDGALATTDILAHHLLGTKLSSNARR